MGNFNFLTPWAFIAVGLLPLMWVFMKTTPPKPKKIKFPAVRILQELTTEKIVADKTPWWILLLRCMIVFGLITALAQPVINQANTIGENDSPIVVIVDNDWSVMDRWGEREQEISSMIDQAERADRPILLLATADPISKDPLAFQTSDKIRARSAALLAKPWHTNRSSWLIKIENLLGVQDEKVDIFWITNGLAEHENERFGERLSELGNLNLISDAQSQIPITIHNVHRSEKGLNIELVSIASKNSREFGLQMINDQGSVVYAHQSIFPSSERNLNLELTFPEELRAQTERIRITGQINAGSQFLMDERWRDKAVGVMAQNSSNHSLMEATFYIDKALAPYVNIRFEPVHELLKRDLSLLVDLGQNSLSKTHRDDIRNWVEEGGLFLRFANEQHSQLTPLNDPLLPVQLIKGVRTFGGALSWKEDPRLAEFEATSPFQGIEFKDEIFVHQQVLARPSSQIDNNTWARLQDGTPLITSKKIGNGHSVLFHISANPESSDLPYSGVFEEMMIRLLSLSTGFSSANPDQELNPYLVFDGNGQLSTASDYVQAITFKSLNDTTSNHQRPPGLYGQANALKAYNLGPQIDDLAPLSATDQPISIQGFDQVNEIDLVPWVLLFVLLLGLVDWLATLKLKQYYKPKTLAVLFALLLSSPALAEKSDPMDWAKVIDASNNMRLAYMATGDPSLDSISKQGLKGLSMILRRRTAVEFSEPMAFNPEKDDPAPFPMIYWPVGETHQDLSEEAAGRLNQFMKAGGFILFDTLGKSQPATLTKISNQLGIGELTTVAEPHVMTRSFYLMQQFPGRYNNPEIWVEANQDASRDRVSSIMVGSNSWAHAWAKDDNLRPLYPVVPGGEFQREQAYRFGVNLVMYILSGNYKGDQVHMPTIIQRLGL